MLKGLTWLGVPDTVVPAGAARLGRGWEELLEHTTQRDRPPCGWDAIQLRLGAKAASGGGLKASSFKPVVYKATPHLFVSLESIREFRRAQRVLVSNQYSCNLEIEELRSLVQFYLISAMAGRDRRLRRNAERPLFCSRPEIEVGASVRGQRPREERA